MLIYLAEKFGAFLPTEHYKRAETLCWLMWQMGSAPFVGGGFGHFFAYAPLKIEYAINRYAMETKRQLHVLDTQLAKHEYVAGDDIPSPTWRSGPGTDRSSARPMAPRNSWARRNMRTSTAGSTWSPRARRCSAGAESTARSARRARSFPSARCERFDAVAEAAPAES